MVRSASSGSRRAVKRTWSGVIVEQGDCNGGWVWFAGDAAELRLQFCQRAHDPLACAESLSVP